MTLTKTKTVKIIPNTERIICKFVDISANLRGKTGLLIPGQLKAGENLLCAQVVAAGMSEKGQPSKFKQGQIIYYSEYSASQLVDVVNVMRAGGDFTAMMQEKNKYIVIAEDDIMAYEEEVDPDFEVIPPDKSSHLKVLLT